MLNNIDAQPNGVDSIMSKASSSIFSEHLIINTLPKDIADMHLAGEINISNSGVWGLIPDTIFLDINDFVEGKLDVKGKFLNVCRVTDLNNLDDFVTAMPILISLLSKEASTEIVLSGILQLLVRQIKEPNDITSQFARILMMSSTAPSNSYPFSGLPITTITIPVDEFDTKSICGLLNGYKKYVDSTPIPRIGLSLNYNSNNNRRINDHSDYIASTVSAGGIVSISQNVVRGSKGIRKLSDSITSTAVMTLQSMSINLPRLAYQSNKDETYFRARLALMIKPAIDAMIARKKIITDLIRKGIIPTLASTQFMQHGITNIVINLTGAKESVYNILGHDYNNNGVEVLQKVLKTTVDVAMDHGKQLGGNSIGIAMVPDDSAKRFAKLDSDKYGKVSLSSTQQITSSYSQELTLNGKELLLSTSADDNRSRSIIEECISIDNLLNGGLCVNVDMNNLSSASELKNAIEVASSSLQFFHPSIKLVVCNTCGNKSIQSAGKCKFCKSPYLRLIQS
jgi:ribonucleoside-triphosphate reductase